MEYRLTIDGSLDGLNSYTKACRTNKFAGASLKKANEEIVSWYIRSQLANVHIRKPAELEFIWIEQNRKRDLDNIAFAKKFILDALTKSGVLENDDWKHVTGFTDRFKVDKENPRIEVTIREVEQYV